MMNHVLGAIPAPKLDDLINDAKHQKANLDARTKELAFELFRKLQAVEACGDDERRELWFAVERGSIEDFGDYEEYLECEEVENQEDFEKLWLDYYPDMVKWYRLTTHSSLIGSDAEALKKAVQEGKIKATLLGETHLSNEQLTGKHELGDRAEINRVCGEDVFYLSDCDNGKIKRVVGFSDNENNFAGIAYIGNTEYKDFVEFVVAGKENERMPKLRDWKATLDGVSLLQVGGMPMAKQYLREGKIKATVIAEIDCPFADNPRHSDSLNSFCYIDADKNDVEMFRSDEQDNSKVKLIIGFSDNQNRYVGHAYLSAEAFKDMQAKVSKEIKCFFCGTSHDSMVCVDCLPEAEQKLRKLNGLINELKDLLKTSGTPSEQDECPICDIIAGSIRGYELAASLGKLKRIEAV